MNQSNKSAYFKYSGNAVQEGIIDSKVAGEALLGFSKSLKHIVKVQHPYLEDLEIHTPVKIQKGSWEALIPNSIEAWLTTAIGVSATAYCVKVAQKLAENGFKDKTLTDVVKDAAKALIWTIRLSKHLGTTAKKRFENVKWRNNNEEAGITNEQRQILWIPVYILKIYHRIPESFYKGLIKGVDHNRTLKIGNYEGDYLDEVEVSHRDKSIFVDEVEDDTEFVFPELEHGDNVIKFYWLQIPRAYIELHPRVRKYKKI